MNMGVKLFISCLIVLAVQISGTHCQVMVNNNMVASILQDILSPAHTQSAMQLLQMAAGGSTRRIAGPEVVTSSRISNIPIETAIPVRTMMPFEVMPRKYVAEEVEQPKFISKLEVMPVGNDRISARFMPNMMNAVPEVMPWQYSQAMVEPCPMMAQSFANYARPPAEILPAMNPSIVSPYLPVASPVSAFAPPMSNMLPPPTQARNQYLRKVPIPPPTL